MPKSSLPRVRKDLGIVTKSIEGDRHVTYGRIRTERPNHSVRNPSPGFGVDARRAIRADNPEKTTYYEHKPDSIGHQPSAKRNEKEHFKSGGSVGNLPTKAKSTNHAHEYYKQSKVNPTGTPFSSAQIEKRRNEANKSAGDARSTQKPKK